MVVYLNKCDQMADEDMLELVEMEVKVGSSISIYFLVLKICIALSSRELTILPLISHDWYVVSRCSRDRRSENSFSKLSGTFVQIRVRW